jgi:ABC-type antimicrobial peptide transport system permease subunit
MIIGIAQANGIRKWNIAFSLIPFSLISSAIGAIAGYIVGFLLQNTLIDLLDSY